MQNINKDSLYRLHTLVAEVLEEELSRDEPSLKAVEVAIKFLKDNQIHVDMTKDKKDSRSLQKLRVIPRLTQSELSLG